MAPILATATGFTPQVLDDLLLQELLQSLQTISIETIDQELPRLMGLLEPWTGIANTQPRIFEEQIDLHEWIHPLNVLDAALEWILQTYSSQILLVEPIKDAKRSRRRQRLQPSSASRSPPVPQSVTEANGSLATMVVYPVALQCEDLRGIPPTIVPYLTCLLTFTATLLRNSTGKSIYQSVPHLTDLLAAADDTVADLALAALQALAVPPAIHKQHDMDPRIHATQLHQLVSEHGWIVALARGWGTKATGLGLAAAVTADDSIHGQGSLPAALGEVHFSYYLICNDTATDPTRQCSDELAQIITLSESEILSDNAMMVDDGSSGDEASSSNKRRRVSGRRATKPTAALFFLALEKSGGRDRIPADRLFSLLADIRLARSYHSRATRIQAVERRLRSLVTMLHSHPAQEVVMSYFQAQPELCVEIVDLLRPIVSSANLTVAAVDAGTSFSPPLNRQDVISALAGSASQPIPYSIRMLAVEALSALVLRKEGMSTAVSWSARLRNVLIELGVGKGQYLGVLPTLIRYSLSCLNLVPLANAESNMTSPVDTDGDVSDSLAAGLAFMEATQMEQIPRRLQVEQALEFVDEVLTLTSAVLAAPSGSVALVDCGLIPTLLTTVSLDPQLILQNLLHGADYSPDEFSRIRSLLRFIMTQAVQILEGAFISHGTALATFHELNGVDVLLQSITRELTSTLPSSTLDEDGDESMKVTAAPTQVSIRSSQRVFLYALITCLPVVFHRELTPASSSSIPTGGAELQKPALTRALIVILDNIEHFGGHLASLIATMLADILNSDPHVVHYVHSSGIAKSFLDMLVRSTNVADDQREEIIEPILPPVQELITNIPNVIGALSLTEDGAKAVKESNPFPALLRIFYHPKYAMPNSRCLLNETTTVFGSGLDEIMRHVERLRPVILSAVTEAMNHVVEFAENLVSLEDSESVGSNDNVVAMRTCLIQYVMNFGQLLEQILTQEDHREPFVEAGGLDALLKIFSSSMPHGIHFLSHVTGMSSPSVGTLHHSKLEESLSVTLKYLFMRYDTQKLIKKLTEVSTHYLDAFETSRRELLGDTEGSAVDLFPREPFLGGAQPADSERIRLLANYLRQASHVQWITNIVATGIRTASQRSQDSGTGWSRAEREWKKELSLESFENLISRLAEFHRSAIFDVCRVRTEVFYEALERERLTRRPRDIRFKLRIVCPEGAVVRDGIEIDSCANVGSMEMGEIVEAYDRCINSSGIMRYRTHRGWVSEMTRGHEREPISEVLSLWKIDQMNDDGDDDSNGRRIEAGIPDMRTVAVCVMARGQAGFSELFSSLSKLVTQGIGSMPIRTVSFDRGTQGEHVSSMISILSTNIQMGLNNPRIISTIRPSGEAPVAITNAGAAMYLGCLLNHICMCLFEDRRERRVVNFPLLVTLVASSASSTLSIYDAIRYVLEHGLTDFAGRAQAFVQGSCDWEPLQRVSRSVAASYPPLIALLRKLMSTPLSSSPAASIMSRMKWRDVSLLLKSNDIQCQDDSGASNGFFRPESFSRDLQLSVSEIVKEIWLDPRIEHAPPFLVHPIASVVGDVLVCLEEASKKKGSGGRQSNPIQDSLTLSVRRRANDGGNEEQEDDFEPSEDAISRLMDMGFSRDHALDALESTRSNRVELATEYALSHAPPSPGTMARRRVEREERARRRGEGRGSENDATGIDQETSGQHVTDRLPQELDEHSSEHNAQPDPMGTENSHVEAQDTAQDEKPPEEPPGDVELKRVNDALVSWINAVPHMACNILAACDRAHDNTEKSSLWRRNARRDGDAEGEALTVVLSSFLLDLCHRYPDKRKEILRGIFERLKEKLKPTEVDEMSFEIPANAEAGAASLCHAAILFMHALPKTRLIVLELNILSALISCVLSYLSKAEDAADCFPLWFTPALLFLDTMAQPLVAFSDMNEDEIDAQGGDLTEVGKEHRAKLLELKKVADAVFSVINGHKIRQKENELEGNNSLLSSIPAYFPLMPSKVAVSCLQVCRQLIVSLPQRGFELPPGLAHAALLLLLRLSRSPITSAECLHVGMPEAILQLSEKSRFTGNTGLVTMIFRRFIEDDSTLQTTMESEIRSTILKLSKKNNHTSLEDAEVSTSSFLEAITPIICREPETFLKALALCVEVDHKYSGSPTTIKLISSKLRSSRAESLGEALRLSGYDSTQSSTHDVCRTLDPLNKKAMPPLKISKSPPRSSRRNSFSKKNKKEKTDNVKISHGGADNAAAHVTCILIDAILSLAVAEDSTTTQFQSSSFFLLSDLLQILADLILALPACAAATHSFKTYRVKERLRKGLPAHFEHALKGSPHPPRTLISFILHFILPQDRWSIRMDRQLWDRRKDSDDDPDRVKERKARAYRIVKVSQTAARVLAALVARPGEGRKRVIADLCFALSGGRLGHHHLNFTNGKYTPLACLSSELCALQAWGELCLGFAAPRSNGKNLNGPSSFSIEVIRLMLDNGMAHALLFAMNRINLLHPMASTTCSVLLLPLEVLTRGSVTAAVKEMIDKESNAKQERSCLQVDDKSNMADALECDELAPVVEYSINMSDREPVDFQILANAEQAIDDIAEDVAMDDAENESSEEEEVQSSVGSHATSESSSVNTGSSGIEDEEDDISDAEDSESEESDGGDEDGDWDVDYEDGYTAGEGNLEQFDIDDNEEDGFDPADQEVDEGWTRIESNGFGSMLLGRRAGAIVGGIDVDANRARGVIDAAEAMIGSLLRDTEISNEGLADIEGSLGIRILTGVRSLGAEHVAIRVVAGDNRQDQDRRTEVMGTLPHIHQRSRPDVGYSAFGRGGQWGDANSMEYVYGGPSVTSGNRNYNILSAAPNDSEPDPPSLAQIDLLLFPGSPAASTSSHSQHSLHPLLCGVDLPPMNSLVSDLLPHGQRAARRGQMATRRPGDWGNTAIAPGAYLVSTSSGNIIRSNRNQLGTSILGGFHSRRLSGPVGWTDEGLPVDATVHEFATVFERALREERTLASSLPQTTNPDESTGNVNSSAMAMNDSGGSNGHDEALTSLSPPFEGDIAHPDQEQSSVRSDGEQVASSLEAGLRLSPGSERSADSNARRLAIDEPEDAETALQMEESACHTHEGQESDQTHLTSHNVASEPIAEPASAVAETVTTEVNNSLICPPNVDPEVFLSLPVDMQHDCIAQYQATQELAAQLDGSTLDPEVLAALPEDLRREVLEEDRRSRLRQSNQNETPADPAHAEDMDNASFIASLSPELREDILLTVDEALLNSLPPNIVAEAQILRQRATSQNRHAVNEGLTHRSETENIESGNTREDALSGQQEMRGSTVGVSSRRRQRSGKIRVEIDSTEIVYLPSNLTSPFSKYDLKTLVNVFFLFAPIRPQRTLQKFLQNLCAHADLRRFFTSVFVNLLHEDGKRVNDAIHSFAETFQASDEWRKNVDLFFSDSSDFPRSTLLGAAPDFSDFDSFNLSTSTHRPRNRLGNAASTSANFPSVSHCNSTLPPIVASRIIETMMHLCKNSARFCMHALIGETDRGNRGECETSFERLLSLLAKPMFSKSPSNLEELLSLLEYTVSPLSHITRHPEEETELSQKEIESAAQAGKEWLVVPRVEVTQPKLQLLCSILKMETCRDTAFAKVNTIIRRLCRVEANRGYVLGELASVAHALGLDALRDLRSLKIQMEDAVSRHDRFPDISKTPSSQENDIGRVGLIGSVTGSITLSTSTSELKLLRVLQTLQALCNDTNDDSGSKKNDTSIVVTDELVHLLRQMELDALWEELSSCLTMVQVLEGVKNFETDENPSNDEVDSNEEESIEGSGTKAKKLRNSAAGLLTRFLPCMEAFFIANASATRSSSAGEPESIKLDDLVGGQRVISFVSNNKVLLNAVVRNNAGLLEKGLRVLVQVPRCRTFLDFDVKRQWFKTQVRRLRQQAGRRGHQNLRLLIRRKYVFEDAYHQLRLRNAEEMRGRLHITFQHEEGVDGGGLSREFFAILAKEIFNPNYALFTSTEDGCTFQPNANSSINPDHLSYFRFVGRIVGKAVLDGYLLDAHFTRSLYKHMLGLQPTHEDMEAIDPVYYNNLKKVLAYHLEDIGLDLTFSIEDQTFGRSQVIDLKPNGRNIPVTEDTKEEYVRLVCHHRMTSAIHSQIKAYLDGFYELVSPELVAIFTPRELELLISGLPDIDIDDLKRNTEYFEWKATDPQIEWFWNIMFSLSRNEKASFLQFATGSSKVPLNGFADLQGMRGAQKFSIKKANGPKGALMSAHTCFNQLELPLYESEEETREKLLYAINEGGDAFLFA